MNAERLSAERVAEIRRFYPHDEVVRDLLAELDAVTAERDAARVDAARYQWLRDNSQYSEWPYPAMCEGDSDSWWEFPNDPVIDDRGTAYPTLDAAIDAAMTPTPEAPRVA